MQDSVEYTEVDELLRRCGATWDAAQAHGLLCSRLSLRGADAGGEWLGFLFEGAGRGSREECVATLRTLFAVTFGTLAERQSQFAPLLPDDADSPAARTAALAHWCEGYLHGLVAAKHDERIKARLAAEPLAGIIRDLLEMTCATVDAEAPEETNEEAYTELVEYIRVATQLVYEELAEFRPPAGRDAAGNVSKPLN